MSTSPSWFDQDKFSRLAKKAAPKSAAVPATARILRDLKRAEKTPGIPARPANRIPSGALAPSVKASQPIQAKTGTLPPPPGNSPADVAPLPVPLADPMPETDETATPSFPASVPPPETRSVSPLAKRTTPLPDLKSLFEYDKSPEPKSEPSSFPSATRPKIPPPDAAEMRLPYLGSDLPDDKSIRSIGPQQIDSKTEMPEPDIDDRDVPIEPPTPLAEEEIPGETDEARPGEMALLRSQLSQQDDLVKQRDDLASQVEQLSSAAQERDDARHEAAMLRARLIQAGDVGAGTVGTDSASTEELARAIEDRDQARRDYALLRERFETMKSEQLRSRQEAPRRDPDAQREVELLRAQLAEREEELNSLKLDPIGVDPEVDSLREEADLLQKQLNKAREEASIAQRGLALSQKALQETRDALRESSESTSQMRSSLESLKNEYATLVQQNTLLQAQYDQLTREVSTLRTKSLPRSVSKL